MDWGMEYNKKFGFFINKIYKENILSNSGTDLKFI